MICINRIAESEPPAVYAASVNESETITAPRVVPRLALDMSLFCGGIVPAMEFAPFSERS